MPASGLPGGGRISQWIPGPIVVVERSTLRTVDGREFKVSTPGRVFYPATGTTKREVIDYYLAVADVMLPHLSGRPATRKRWPDGVDGPELCAKDIELGTQEWMTPGTDPALVRSEVLPDHQRPRRAGLAGPGRCPELHVPQRRIPPATGPSGITSTSTERHPDRVVFDLHPGPGVGLPECARVALYLRERWTGWVSGPCR